MIAELKPLRILLVEDSLDDAGLILFELEEGGFDVVYRRVETEAAMRDAVASNGWDVVISDFNLPRFNSRKALAILRAAGETIPFIIVSGCIGEEAATALIKEGVSDFVMKDKLARLPSVVKRELRDAAVRRERQEALEALSASEKLLDGITSCLGEGIIVLNAEGKCVFMNPEAERLLEWKKEELLGQDMSGIFHVPIWDGLPPNESERGVLGALRDGIAYKSDDDFLVHKSGTRIPVSCVATALMEERHAIAVVVAFQDISQRKQANLELLESRRQLQKLSSHLQTVREEERTRIARELHDQLGQMLMGVKLDAKWLASALSNKDPLIMDKIASMYQLIDDTLNAMRRIASELRPVMLDDLGLVAALEWLAEEFGKRTGLHIRFEQEIDQEQCSELSQMSGVNTEVVTAAFRIVQECLTNITKHAQALHVVVFLRCGDNELFLRVSDDGKGVELVNTTKGNSFGTIGMRERAHALGGALNISTAPGEGYSVEVVLPMKRNILAGAAP